MADFIGPHWGFIVASYGLTLVVVTGLIAWVVVDHGAQRRRLAEMEARGLRRRSAATAVAEAAAAVPGETRP